MPYDRQPIFHPKIYYIHKKAVILHVANVAVSVFPWLLWNSTVEGKAAIKEISILSNVFLWGCQDWQTACIYLSLFPVCSQSVVSLFPDVVTEGITGFNQMKT